MTLGEEAATLARPAAIGRGLAEGGAGFAGFSRPFLTAADGRGPGSGERLRSLESWQVGVAVACGVEPGERVVWGVAFSFEF